MALPTHFSKFVRFAQAVRLEKHVVSVEATQVLSERFETLSETLLVLLMEHPQEVLLGNLLNLLVELAMRDPKWRKLIRRETRPNGRVPRSIAPILRKQIHDLSNNLAGITETKLREKVKRAVAILNVERDKWKSGAAAEQPQIVSKRNRIEIPFTTGLTSIESMEVLAGVLSRIPPTTSTVVCKFGGIEHVYVVGLAALLAWKHKSGIDLQIQGASKSTQEYLERIGFQRGIELDEPVFADSLKGWAMAFARIQRERVEEISDRISDIIKKQMEITEKDQNALFVLFSELLENTIRHAGDDASGFVAAQTYPSRRKLTIVIVDNGMGLRGSFINGTNEEVKDRIAAGESPCELACAPLVTSKPHLGHSGYGLYVVSELTVRNNGTFRVMSDSEIYTRFRVGWDRKHELRNARGRGWEGTWISILLDLENSLPLLDVYASLPPIRGADDLEDFFQ